MQHIIMGNIFLIKDQTDLKISLFDSLQSCDYEYFKHKI